MARSVSWIQSLQLKDGCFDPVGYVIHKELAGTKQSLTASVLVTLLEIRKNGLDVKVDDAVIKGKVGVSTE